MMVGLFLVIVAQLHAGGVAGEAMNADALVASIRKELGQHGIRPMEGGGSPAKAEIRRNPGAVHAEQYQHLVRKDTWKEVWLDAAGKEQKITVTAEIWAAAIQAALDEHKVVLVSRRSQPYYLDAPLVLKSGCRLLVDPAAEIRLKPGTNACMVRNENMVISDQKPVSLGPNPDRDILVAGGIWTTLAFHRGDPANGNLGGGPGPNWKKYANGAFGVMLFTNVDGLQVKGVTIKESNPFAIHMSLCRNFLIEDITLLDHYCDGVHINGPASDGIVREVHGSTGDDLLALNGWDWLGSAMTFGPISRLWVQDLQGTLRPQGHPSSSGVSSLRLLAGTKRYPNGEKLACDISDCVFDRLYGLRVIRMYDQPDAGCPDKDFADPIGRMANLHFRHLDVYRSSGDRPFAWTPPPGIRPLIEIASNVDGMQVEDVTLHFDLRQPPLDSYKLIAIGPKSDTIRCAPPRTWFELYSPDKDCTVRNLRVSPIRYLADGGEARQVPGESLVHVFSQKPNPDYPKTTPKGGTGKGFWIR